MKKKKKSRVVAVLLTIAMIVSNLSGVAIPVYAESSGSSFTDFATDDLVAEYDFGSEVTEQTLYTPELGYGFSTVEYPNQAPGWVGGVYYPRVQSVSGSAFYVSAVSGSAINTSAVSGSALNISSKVWKETESSGYGVYTYENTSVFNADLLNADYNVTVTLVNPTDTAYTAYLEAEDITKASGIVVAPGATVDTTITAILVDGQLNLKFLAASSATQEDLASPGSVYVSKVSIIRQATNEVAAKPTVFIASDSTVQTYDSYYYPQTGWGQTLFNFFGELVEERECTDCEYSQSQTYETENVVIENRAIGGRSSKSFIEEGKLDDLLEDVKPGDYILVQWGHNDATYSRPNRYVSVDEFPQILQYYIDGCKQRGATPVLVTPVARYSPNADGTFGSNFEGYRQAMIALGAAQNIPVLDLTGASIALCESFGVEGAKSLFLHLAAGDYEGAYAGGVTDSTHLQYYGAYKFAQCVAKLIQSYSTDSQLDALKTCVVLNAPTTAPEAVVNLTPVTVGATSVSFTWSPANGAELYYIYRAELASGTTIDSVDFTNAEKYSVSSVTKYTDKSCEGGKTYVYAVRGFNEFGLGGFSEKIEVSTRSALYKYDFDNSATDPIMDGWLQVTATQKYDASLGYGWITAPGGGRYRANNGNAASSAMADDFCLGNGEFAVDLPNGDYEIKVYAGDLMSGTSTIKSSYTAEGASIGGVSAKQTIGTTSGTVRVTDGQLNVIVGGTNPYINGMEITPILLAPSNLSYSELEFKGSNAEFLINFDGISEAVSYRIYQKSTTDLEFSVVKTIAAADKDNLDARAMVARIGETREYYVAAVIADGSESAPSKSIVIEMTDPNAPKPAAPVNLVCTSASEAYIAIQWDAVDGAIYYNVYRSTRAEGTKGYTGFKKIGEALTALYYDTDNDIDTNVHYYYKVEAVGLGGIGEKSGMLQTPITDTLVRTAAEKLTDRALVAVDLAGDKGAEINVTTKDSAGNELTSGVFLSWRLFENDPDDITFTVYRNDVAIASGLKVTNCVDPEGTTGDSYKVVGSSDSTLGLNTVATDTWDNYFIEMQLQKPADQVLPDGNVSSYTANDMSVGDLDKDGAYELIVKWYPTYAKDNSGYGYTGTTVLDAYDINTATGEATLLWRIDLGINIRSGAHYTQFQVWDFDGDGSAELICKTADGSTTYQNMGGILTETGYVGACSASALPTDTISSVNDYRNSDGYILDGPEYLTIFDGETGRILDTTEYVPERGNVSAWGDAYGNRVDRFLSAVAYLDGENASAIFARGYYSRTCLTAYDFVDTDGDGIGNELQIRWKFDTNDYPVSIYGETEAQGNHGLSINDVDQDGKDEIIYGALVVEHDGNLKYVTGLGHGDAMHVSDWIPSNPGLEIFSVHEHTNAAYQVEVHDAETGEVLWGYFTGKDTGRGVAADVDPTFEGAEFWANAAWNGTDGGMYSSLSTLTEFIQLSTTTPSVNFTLFWDGDLLSELQDHTFNEASYVPVSTNITKWNYLSETSEKLFESTQVYTSNGTKGNLGLVADVLGDWREEIIARCSADASKVRIYTSTIISDYTIPCLMENAAYRIGVAWQNVGYNQPANLDYLLSEGIKTSNLITGAVGRDSVSIIFTEASDGAYGHAVTGYEVYRATEGGDYTLIDTLDLDELIEVTVDGNPVEQPVEYKFDFGASTVQEGWTQIVAASPSYEENGTYGFTTASIALVLNDKAYSTSSITELPAMYGDCVLGWSASPYEFVVDVPNGTYEVTYYTYNGSGSQYNQVTIENTALTEIRYGNSSKNAVSQTVTVEVTDGTINVINISSKANNLAIYFNGLTIKRILESTEDTDPNTYYGYTDSTVASDTNYTYVLAAVVDGKTSFKSNPTGAKTLVNITSIPEFVLSDLVEDTPIPDGGTVADLLPDALTVIDQNNTETIADVTWDVSAVNITEPGDYVVIGTIAGYTGTINKTVTVVPNTISSYEFNGFTKTSDTEPYYTTYTVLNALDLGLPAKVIFRYLNGTTEEAAVTWDTSAVDITAKATYVALGTTAALTASGGKFGTQTVKMNVEVKDDYITGFENLPIIEGVIGSTVEEFETKLPTTVYAVYKSGKKENVAVTWNTTVTEEQLAVAGNFNITGTVDNYSGTVTLTAYIDYKAVWKFDFGISTADVETGWTGVTVNGKGGGKTMDALGATYSAEKGYGFLSGTATTEGRKEGYTYSGILPPLVYRDYVLPDGQTFLIDVPNGTYQVEYSAGSYYKGKVSLVVEGSLSSSTSNAAETYNIGKVSNVVVSDGQISIYFPTGVTSRLNAIIIRQVSLSSTDPVTPSPEPITPTPEPTTPTPEPVTPSPDPVTPSPDPVTPSPDPVTPSPDPVTPSPEPITPSPDPVTPSPDPVTPSPDPVTPSPDPVSPSPDPVSPSPDPLTPTPSLTPSPTPTPTPSPTPTLSPVTPTPDPVTPTPIPQPQVEGVDGLEGWEDIIEFLDQAEEEEQPEKLIIQAGSDAILPGEAMDAIRGKDITVELQFEGYSWIINGNDITDEHLEDIDLSIARTAELIPDTVIQTVAGENAYIPLQLAHNGQFGLKATLCIQVGQVNNGRIAHLFYYNPVTGELQLQSVHRVDENGAANLSFYHASDYVVVFSDEGMLEEDFESIKVAVTAKTLYVGGNTGGTAQMGTIMSPALVEAVEKELTQITTTYTSSNEKVVTVSEEGKITAIGKGKATITTSITMGDITRTFKTIINVKNAYFRILKVTESMKVGEEFTFVIRVCGYNQEDVQYTTTNKSIITIGKKTGKATADSKGIDYVVVKCGKLTKKIKVTVK